MKKRNKKKQTKKGFTLVELLAVIVILAIVVGISMTTVLSVIKDSKKKALQVAADSLAKWIDQQYELYESGVTYSGMATVNEAFIDTCIGTNRCMEKVNHIPKDLIVAAGLKHDNFNKVPETSGPVGSPRYRSAWHRNYTSRVYIDPNTGKSCVTLVTKPASVSIDFPNEAIACGGTCKTRTSSFSYCKPYNME